MKKQKVFTKRTLDALKNIDGLTISQLFRLRNLEVVVKHYGFVQREMLSDINQIGIAATSKDISLYASLNEGVFYNRKTRRIEKTSTFKELFNDTNNDKR